MKRILIIDDSNVLRKITVFNLKKLGYEIQEAIDGVDGLEKIKKFQPDLVLLDIMMPRMDGFTVLKRMSEDPDMKNIPVIVLTAKGGENDEKEALKLGAMKVLTKPFSPKQLVETVKQVVENE